MRNPGNWVMLLFVVALTAFSFITVWPSDPDRYLPNFIPWPKGRGIDITVPTIQGGTFGLTDLKRETMSLGLDLRGGTRLVLAPEEGVQVDDLDSALEGAQKVIERRVNEFGVAESEVNRLGGDRLSVQLPGIDPEEAISKIGRTALLQFCVPVMDAAGNVAIARTGTVQYQPQTCDPLRDQAGDIIVDGGSAEFTPWPPEEAPVAYTRDQLVWQPAKGDLDGVERELTGRFLRQNTFVSLDTIFNTPLLSFEWNGDGAEISEQVTERLARDRLPLAPFLDGEPIRGDDGGIIAPTVQGVITNRGQIDGLSLAEAQDLSTLLNTGAFPIPLRIIQQQDVDATLGESAVRNSVIAGEIALILIMVFMILYYRLPGLMASLALIVYASFVLAIFKIWPVTLTLSGVGAFVLSIGMAVDANILIFERMKEELRVGRNLIVALEDGFNRAWSSIRDSNIATLITCGILFWFGGQFDEAAIKGFAVTLAIGVIVSMFSAITVSRTFMRVIVGFQPIARRLSLFMADMPETQTQEVQRAPAVAGAAGRTEER